MNESFYFQAARPIETSRKTDKCKLHLQTTTNYNTQVQTIWR